MMSTKQALRSYRRAVRRAYRDGRRMATHPTHPLMAEMCRRGDRLQRIWSRASALPVEVADSLTTRDLEALANDDDNAFLF